jgi:hypothetical protein
VVLEAAYGWYWAVDALRPRARCCIWRTRWGEKVEYRRVKHDERDATRYARALMG